MNGDALQSAVEALRRQDYRAATETCRRLLDADRKNTGALDVMSQIAYETGRSDESVEYLKKAVLLEPKSARLRTNLGRALTRLGRFREAHVQYDKSLKIAPQDPIALTEKATAYERQDKYDRARRVLRPFVEGRGRHQPPPPLPPSIASVYLRVLIHDGDLDEAIEIGLRVIEAASEPSPFLRRACFELARAYERSGRIDEAFAAARRGNAMTAPRFDPAQDAAAVDAIISTLSAERLRVLPRPSAPSEKPIFVFGMPRSGTTLVERIIHAHPDAHGCGETAHVHALAAGLGTRIGSMEPYPACVLGLTPVLADEESAALVAALSRRAPDAARLSDKSLDNTWYLGLISILFPTARAIHCRRDPMDTCLSCYMEPLMPASAPYASDLRHLGLHYREYDRLMHHWIDAIDMPLLEVGYEELIADQEAVTRRIIDFCGLGWNDACLRFYEVDRQDRTLSFDQVCKPLYASSVGRAGRFGMLLDPLREAMALPPAAGSGNEE